MKTHALLLAMLGLSALGGCRNPNLLNVGSRNSAEQNRVVAPAIPAGTPMPVAQNTSPDTTADLLQRAHQASQQNQLAEAKLLYTQILQQRPDQVEAHHRLAIVADRLQEFELAEQHYRAALQLRPGDANVLSDLGYSYLLRGQHDQSEAYLLQALKFNPTHTQAVKNLGLLKAQRGDYYGALATFRRTGTEDEAQRHMQMLFPNGAPKPEQYAGAGQQPAGPMTAQTAAPFADPAADVPQRGSSAADAPNETTRELKELMEKAREQSLAARHQNATRTIPADAQQLGNPHANTPQDASGSPFAQASATFSNRPEAGATEQATYDPRQAEAARLRKDFARIDAMPARPAHPESPFPEFGQSPPTALPPHIPTQPAQRDVDPLDAMPLWAGGADSQASRGSVQPIAVESDPNQMTPGEGVQHANLQQPASPWPHQQQPGAMQASFTANNAAPPVQTPDQQPTGALALPSDDLRRTAALMGLGAGPGPPFPALQPGSPVTAQYGQAFPAEQVLLNGSQFPQPPAWSEPTQFATNQPNAWGGTGWQHPGSAMPGAPGTSAQSGQTPFPQANTLPAYGAPAEQSPFAGAGSQGTSADPLKAYEAELQRQHQRTNGYPAAGQPGIQYPPSQPIQQTQRLPEINPAFPASARQ